MIDRSKRFSLPKTVEEAVNVLIADLTTQQMDTMAHMSDEAFDAFCRKLVPYVEQDFHIWSGNDTLLMDCLDSVPDAAGTEPVRIILDRMRERLSADHGAYFVI